MIRKGLPLVLVGCSQVPERKGASNVLVIGIDPGTDAGITFGYQPLEFATLGINFEPKPGTKKREAEPAYYRIGRIFETLMDVLDIATKHNRTPTQGIVIMEGMYGIRKSNKQLQVGFELRGAIKAFGYNAGFPLLEIQPNDLKRYAIGKTGADKPEMIQATRKFGYKGNNDDVADSIHCYQYGHEFSANIIQPTPAQLTL